MMKILVMVLTLLQIIMRITCIPSYVISSYSNVRLQQPNSAKLSVESQMPMDIMLNPKLADEPPEQNDKMESIFMRNNEQVTLKNLKTMNMDESEMMEAINKQNLSQTTQNEKVFDESDLVALGQMEPAGFALT